MELLACPYNVSHQIRPERMQYHLLKCKAQNPETTLEICPFNAIHHIRKSDQVEHLQNCPDRGIVEIQKYRFNAAVPGHHGNLTTPLVFGSSSIRPELSDQQHSEERIELGNRRVDMRRKREILMKQNQLIQKITSGASSSAKYNITPFQGSSDYCVDENMSTTDGFETCNTSITSANEDVNYRQTPNRTRSPSPVPSIRSIPKIYRYGRTSPRPAPATLPDIRQAPYDATLSQMRSPIRSPSPAPSVQNIPYVQPYGRKVVSLMPINVLEPRQTLRRPRTVFDPRAEIMKPSLT